MVIQLTGQILIGALYRFRGDINSSFHSYLNWWHFEQPGELPHAELAPLGLREGGRDEVAAHHARDEPVSPPFDPTLVEGQPRYEPGSS